MILCSIVLTSVIYICKIDSLKLHDNELQYIILSYFVTQMTFMLIYFEKEGV